MEGEKDERERRERERERERERLVDNDEEGLRTLLLIPSSGCLGTLGLLGA